jgi:hypothetical protein
MGAIVAGPAGIEKDDGPVPRALAPASPAGDDARLTNEIRPS